jgi:hypothetical protein
MSITVESTTDSAAVVSSLMQPEAEAVPSGADSSAESQPEPAGESEAPEDETQPSSEDDSSEEESGDEEEKPAPKKGKGGFQRRIDRLTTERNMALQRLQEIERGLAGSQPAATPQPQQPAPTAEKPTVDKFDSYEAYIEAVADWKLEQREKARQAESARTLAEQQRTEKVTAFNERLETARDKYADFDEALSGSARVQISPAMHEAILESETGPDIAYHLAKNPAEALRIAKLSPIAAAKEIGKLETKLSAAAEEPAKPATASRKTTVAPEPARPVAGGTTVVERNPDSMSYQDYKRFRLAQQGKKR